MSYQSQKDEWLAEIEWLLECYPEADMDELKALAMTNVLKQQNQMSKTSKIVSFKEGKQLEYGKVYAITFDNGDKGEAIEKSEPNIGDEWQYDISETQYGNKIKRVKVGGFQPKGGSYSKEPFEERAVASAYNQTAVLFSHKAVEEGKSFTIDQYITASNKVYDAMLLTAKRGKG